MFYLLKDPSQSREIRGSNPVRSRVSINPTSGTCCYWIEAKHWCVRCPIVSIWSSWCFGHKTSEAVAHWRHGCPAWHMRKRYMYTCCLRSLMIETFAIFNLASLIPCSEIQFDHNYLKTRASHECGRCELSAAHIGLFSGRTWNGFLPASGWSLVSSPPLPVRQPLSFKELPRSDGLASTYIWSPGSPLAPVWFIYPPYYQTLS